MPVMERTKTVPQVTNTQIVIGKIMTIDRAYKADEMSFSKATNELAKVYKQHLLTPQIPPLVIPSELKAKAVFAWQILNGEPEKRDRRRMILRHLLNK